MSFFSGLFKRRIIQEPTNPAPEIAILDSFEPEIEKILSKDSYIPRSQYRHITKSFSSLYETFCQLRNTHTLNYFCRQQSVSKDKVESFLKIYDDFNSHSGSKLIKKHNQEYLKRHLQKEKDYLDHILDQVDRNIRLDEEQRKVVLSDEDHMLVVAGAGAGKTTTVAAKVKYLVDKKGISPKEILVISFTNKAVDELRDRINRSLGIGCPITTFHKTGYAVLKRQEEENLRIVDSGFLFNVINNYLKGNILENPNLVDKLILFFGSYFDAPYEGEDLNDFFNYITKADFSTLRGNMDEYTERIIDQRSGKRISIVHETMRSCQEVLIANFLFMNGIEYEYEKCYPFNIANSHKPYTPDFTITQGDKTAYIEHFGITEDGKNSHYSKEQIEKYKKQVNDKVHLHRQHGTELMYTFSEYRDRRPILEHLKEQLIEHGFELKPRSSKEIFEKIVNTEENRYISRLVKLVCTFIQNFKTNGYGIEDFRKFSASPSNVRSKLFLSICEQCFLEYSKRLKERHAIDFEDMINESTRIIRDEQLKGNKLAFKYIIVDEYQDISRQRFNLTKELSRLCDAKIIAVGDDWQSIYAYAGADITLFTHFRDSFGYAEELHITKTYRNSQELIDIAGGFIQKNSAQIRKSLISPKHIKDPIIIKTYSEEVDRKQNEGKGGKYYLIGHTVEDIMDGILKENPKSSILLLGRYGFDAFNLGKSADFVYDEKNGGLYSKKYNAVYMDFLTVHRAKGLGYDNVILINARNDVYGFPSKIEDDPVLRFVVKTDRSIDYAEERRLFYVALTRTKNRVFLVVPEQHPSEFVTELIQDHPEIRVDGNLIKEQENKPDANRCPVCGYPLQLRYKKSYGLRLWMCTNEPEICDFMTNNLRGGDLSVIKCDKCRDGYLIIKEGGKEPFLGCTNFTADKKGCNNFMSAEYFKRYIAPSLKAGSISDKQR